jgi:hypothetical protein
MLRSTSNLKGDLYNASSGDFSTVGDTVPPDNCNWRNTREMIYYIKQEHIIIIIILLKMLQHCAARVVAV